MRESTTLRDAMPEFYRSITSKTVERFDDIISALIGYSRIDRAIDSVLNTQTPERALLRQRLWESPAEPRPNEG